MLRSMLSNLFFSSGLRWLWIMLLVLALDRYTKNIAYTSLNEYSPLAVIPGLNFVLSFNKGAAFSFLREAGGWQAILFGGIAVMVSFVLLIWLSRLSYRDRWVSIALNLIIGGALGNLWDRLLYGHVIDFIQVYISYLYWPVFNIADSAICVGAFMLFAHSFFKKQGSG